MDLRVMAKNTATFAVSSAPLGLWPFLSVFFHPQIAIPPATAAKRGGGGGGGIRAASAAAAAAAAGFCVV